MAKMCRRMAVIVEIEERRVFKLTVRPDESHYYPTKEVYFGG